MRNSIRHPLTQGCRIFRTGGRVPALFLHENRKYPVRERQKAEFDRHIKYEGTIKKGKDRCARNCMSSNRD